MKIIKILILSYVLGILLCNTVAFIVWLKDPSTTSMDISTIALTLMLSLAWPVAIFGDFMASNNLLRKCMDILIAIVPFVLGFYSEKLINKKILTSKSSGR